MSKITTKSRSAKDFPLTKRSDGRWQKRVDGRTYYFRGTKSEALTEWLRVKDDILGGHDPRPDTGQLTVKQLVNDFLESKDELRENGEITQRSYNDYFATCEQVVKCFGRTRLIETLNAADFKKLRNQLARGRGPVTLRNDIGRIHVLFNHAVKNDLVERPVRGVKSALTKPSKSVIRKHREKNGGDELFTPEQILCLVEKASPQLKAMIFLAINTGCGNTDCSELEPHHIDFENGWLDYSRPKTGIKRRAKLWDETVEAIAAAGLPFRTCMGAKWVSRSSSDNALSKEFRKLLDSCGIKSKGLTFYRLRHTFRTEADAVKDPVACDLAMGHGKDDMASNYRHRIDDDRLEAIASTVHGWLYPDATSCSRT